MGLIDEIVVGLIDELEYFLQAESWKSFELNFEHFEASLEIDLQLEDFAN